jgi:Tol biopolymer transport system component
MIRWNLLSLLLVTTSLCPVYGQAHDAVEVFEPGLISTGHEAAITFTPDGKVLYFARRVERKSPAHIYRSTLDNQRWQKPEEVHLGADDWFDVDPFVTPDGEHLFFASTRPTGAGTPAKPSMHIWVADRGADGWANPRLVENINSDAKEGTPAVSRDRTLYFFSDRQAEPNKNSIYESKFAHGKYTAALRLPAAINSGTSDTSPFISPNGKVLLFYSTRPGGIGDADIYVSFLRHGTWSEPVNLGPTVNSSEEEDNPVVSPDGKQFFFGRNGNFYVIPVASIPALMNVKFR